MAAVFADALEFAAEVEVFSQLAMASAVFRADAADMEQLGLGRRQDCGSLAEMLEQLPYAHRPDMLDEVQRNESFPESTRFGYLFSELEQAKAECDRPGRSKVERKEELDHFAPAGPCGRSHSAVAVPPNHVMCAPWAST